MPRDRVATVLSYLVCFAVPCTSYAQPADVQVAPATGAANKEMVRRLSTEAWGARDLAVADQMLAPGYVLHNGT